jgi:hypothetical protein
MTMVQDYLGYEYIVSQMCHRQNACIRCMDDTMWVQLKREPGPSKSIYMGHRRWLSKSDPWKKCGDLFNGGVEL